MDQTVAETEDNGDDVNQPVAETEDNEDDVNQTVAETEDNDDDVNQTVAETEGNSPICTRKMQSCLPKCSAVYILFCIHCCPCGPVYTVTLVRYLLDQSTYDIAFTHCCLARSTYLSDTRMPVVHFRLVFFLVKMHWNVMYTLT